jgi:8-oxo-dGTP diphosphatase
MACAPASTFFDRSGKPVEKPADRVVVPRRSVYGIAVRDGCVLLVRPTWKDTLDVPGGMQEPGETDEQTLRREFIEETGCVVAMEALIAEDRRDFYADDTETYYDSHRLFYRVTIVEEKPFLSDGEIAEVLWVPIADAVVRCDERHAQVVARLVG